MARIVAVHGILQELGGEETLGAAWLPALRDGLRRADGPRPADGDFACAFYGDLFRLEGTKGLDGVPGYDAEDLDEWEVELLRLLATEARAMDPAAAEHIDEAKGRWPTSMQRMLEIVTRSPFFGGLTPRALVLGLKQVGRYFSEENLRDAVRSRVEAAIQVDTRVIVGHSLGSVVAYEVLCHNIHGPVRTFITLGSPLGIRNVIFDRLEPSPRDGVGCWPKSLDRWTNVADTGDIVALVKSLEGLFDGPVENRFVHNGAAPHDVRPYLTAAVTGEAIAAGL